MWHRTAMLAAVAALVAGGCGGAGDDETTQSTGSTPSRSSTADTTSTRTEAAKPQAKPKTKAPAEKAIGIGDQNAAFFAAPAFRALKVDKARRVVPWDTMRLPDEQKAMSQ